jgi:hypothetical protein
MRRITLLLAAVAMMVLVFAPVAQAQTFNERIPLSDTFTSCTGEAVPVEGVLHTVGSFNEDASGGVHIQFHQDFHGQGVGETSGAKYVVTSQGPAVLHSNFGANRALSFTVVSHAKVIRQGEDDTEDDFSARTVIHFTLNADGELTAEVANIEVECQ